MADNKNTEKGRAVEKKDKDGNSPLHAAAKAGHKDVVRVLLDLGFSLEEKNNCGETPLHLASKEGHKSVVEMLLEEGADQSVEDADGATPWHLAAAAGHANILGLLAKRNALNAKKEENDKCTALYDAAKMGDIKTVRDILRKGKNVRLNEKNKDGETALYAAATNGHSELVKILLDAGADWQIEKENGKMLLHDLAADGKVEIIKILGNFKKKGNCSTTDVKGRETSTKTNVFTWGGDKFNKKKSGKPNLENKSNSKKKWEDIYKTSLTADLSDSENDDIEPVIYKECMIGVFIDTLFTADGDSKKLETIQRDTEKHLISRSKADDIDMNKDLGGGFTFLHVAAACITDESFLKVLLERKADPKARTFEGVTTIMFAAAGGLVKNIKLLTAAGADPFTTDAYRRTAMHMAVLHNSKAAIRYLMSIGLDSFARDISGLTPVNIACFNGNSDIISELLSGDSDSKILDSFEKKPLVDNGSSVKEQKGNDNVMKSSEKEGSTEECSRSKHQNPGMDIGLFLLALRSFERFDDEMWINMRRDAINRASIDTININTRNKIGLTALHIAARVGAEEGVRKCLKKKADVSARTRYGSTPFMMAAAGGFVRIMKMLFRAGSDVEATDERMNSALHIAVAKNHVSATKYLLYLGLDPNQATAEGMTPLHIAAKLGNIVIAQILLKSHANADVADDYGMKPAAYALMSGNFVLVQLLTFH